MFSSVCGKAALFDTAGCDMKPGEAMTAPEIGRCGQLVVRSRIYLRVPTAADSSEFLGCCMAPVVRCTNRGSTAGGPQKPSMHGWTACSRPRITRFWCAGATPTPSLA